MRDNKNLISIDEEINDLLDDILDFKKLVVNKTDHVESICKRLESFTWFNQLDEECMRLVNHVIAAARDWRSTLIKQYVNMGSMKKRGIANDEIKNFKSALDDLRETCEDMESVFFNLPKNEVFQAVTSSLILPDNGMFTS